MLKFLTKVDLFGTEEKLQIHSHNPKQKSGFGGVMTIILYGISLAYFFTQFIDWIQNNKLPKITTIKSIIEAGETIQFEGRFLEVDGFGWPDPFDPTNLILIPEIWVCTGLDQICDHYQMQYESIAENGSQKNKFFLDYDQIIGSAYDSIESIYYQIFFVECPGSEFSFGNKQYNCATQEEIQNYLDQQYNSVKITFNVTEFNTKTKQLDKIKKSVEKTISQKKNRIVIIHA